MISRVVTRNVKVHQLRFFLFQWQPQMTSLLLHSLLCTSSMFHFSDLLMECLMPPGPAYNCMNVSKMPKLKPRPLPRLWEFDVSSIHTLSSSFALQKLSSTFFSPGISVTLIYPLIRLHILLGCCPSQRRVWASGT